MIRKLLLTVIIIGFNISLFSQVGTDWKWLHEKPQGNDIRWVKVWDANNWYAVGKGGTFMKTSNAGSTWYFHHNASLPGLSGQLSDLYSAWFFSRDTGIVVGSNANALITTNGGVSFTHISTIQGSAILYDVFFINRLTGWISGQGCLLKTTDGGVNWTPIPGLDPLVTNYRVWTSDGQTIVLSQGAGYIGRSTDGGTSWNQVPTGSSSLLYGMRFWNATTGIVCGTSGAARLTTDAGATWIDVNQGFSTSTSFYDAAYDNGTIYISGGVSTLVKENRGTSTMYKSSNLGSTWDPINIAGSNQIWTGYYFAVSVNAGVALYGGNYGLLNSVIGGNNTCYTSLIRAGINYDIWGNNSGRIIVIGGPTTSSAHDQIMLSTNSGSSWIFPNYHNGKNSESVNGEKTQQENEEDNPLWVEPTFHKLAMVNNNIGYVTGSSSIIYKTTDGGFNWDSLNFPISSAGFFYNIEFVNKDTGWVFSINGDPDKSKIFKTTDGGLTWYRQYYNGGSSNDNSVFSACMVDAKYGWVTTWAANIFKTSDGGITWQMQAMAPHNPYTQLYKIQFLDSLRGFVCGTFDVLQYTTNGGVTWELLNSPAPGNGYWYSMAWLDGQTGILGGVGCTYKTTNRGLTWEYIATGSSISPGMYMTKGDTVNVFACGWYGTAYKYSNFAVNVTPVELTNLACNIDKNNVTLEWSTATELNNKGFEIQRKKAECEFIKIGFLEGKGTSTEQCLYSFTDKDLSAGIYNYRIKQVDFDGTAKYYTLNETITIGHPNQFSLSQNYPNPFNPTTKINFSIPTSGFVKLYIYNSLGQKVAELANEQKEAGYYEVNFSAVNLSSGVYFYKLEMDKYSAVKKLIVLK